MSPNSSELVVALCTNLQRRSSAAPPSLVCRTTRSASHRSACPGSSRWPRCKWPSQAEQKGLACEGQRAARVRIRRCFSERHVWWGFKQSRSPLTWNKEHDASGKGAVEPLEGGEVGKGEDSCDDASEAGHGGEDHESTSGVPVGYGQKSKFSKSGTKITKITARPEITFRLLIQPQIANGSHALFNRSCCTRRSFFQPSIKEVNPILSSRYS